MRSCSSFASASSEVSIGSSRTGYGTLDRYQTPSRNETSQRYYETPSRSGDFTEMSLLKFEVMGRQKGVFYLFDYFKSGSTKASRLSTDFHEEHLSSISHWLKFPFCSAAKVSFKATTNKPIHIQVSNSSEEALVNHASSCKIQLANHKGDRVG